MRASLLVAVCAAAGTASAQPSTFLSFDSQAGDFVGQGQRFTVTPLDGPITAMSWGGEVEVSFHGTSWWYLTFGPPSGTPLVPGQYEGATRWPFQSSTTPGMDVSGEGRGCNMLTGRFTVLEAEFGPSGQVVRLAIDYEQHCEGASPALYGAVRINSAVAAVPRLSVGSAGRQEGDAGTTDLRFAVSLSAPTTSPVSVSYHTADGTAMAGSDYQAVSGSVTFSPGRTAVVVTVPILGDTAVEADETFSLLLDGEVGASIGFGSGVGTILNDDPYKTFLQFDSQAGDPIGLGRRFTLTPLDGTITVVRSEGGVYIDFNGATWWDLHFLPPSGTPLVPGQYEGATRWPFQSPTTPGMDVSGGDGGGCNTLTGRFTVLEAEYGPSGQVVRLAIDYEQHCQGGTPALYGAVRINSAVAAVPRLSVGPAGSYEGDAGTTDLRFAVSLSAPATSPVSVNYHTADGTATAGSDYQAVSGTAMFGVGQTTVVVTVGVLGDTAVEADETFSLLLDGEVGASIGIGSGVGTILNDDPYKTILQFDSQAGDWIGEGLRFTLTPLDGAISAERSGGGVHVHFDGAIWWDLYFLPPSGTPLVPGQYEGATRWPFQSPTTPGMSIWGDGRGCDTLTGRFTVLEAEFDPSGQVVRLAIDYEQHCEGGTSALYGGVRINSAVAAVPRLSVGSAGSYEEDAGTTDLRFAVSLSAPATSPVSVNYHTADGTATAGSDYQAVSGTATLAVGETAVVVTVPILGDTAVEADETLSLILDGVVGAPVAFGGGVGTILNDDPYKTVLEFDSQPGDWVGGGQRFTLTPIDGTISATQSGGGVWVRFRGATLWNLIFMPPAGTPLVPGQYEGATRSSSTTTPGMDVSGDGRGCNALNGRFTVLEVEFGPSGQVVRLAIDYEQHCEGGIPALIGAVRVNSSRPIIHVSVADASVAEGDGGRRDLDLVVSLSHAPSTPVTVTFATRDGTAASGSDYGGYAASAVVPADQTSTLISVPVFGDTLSEADETFYVDLTGAVGALMGTSATAVATILDDDPLPELGASDVAVVEGNPGDSPPLATFTVSLNTPSGRNVSVSYLTQPETAVVDTDFTFTSGTVSFAPGVTSATVTVPIATDSLAEGDETFLLALLSPLHATVARDGVATIIDDEKPLGFYTVPPCRLLDTRLSGPAVDANTTRTFVAAGACGIPTTALALAVSVTAAGASDRGHFRLYPAGRPAPNTSVLNFVAGITRAGNAVVSTGTTGMVTVMCTMPAGSAHVIVDVSGYFQ